MACGSTTSSAGTHHWKFIIAADEARAGWGWVHCVEHRVLQRTEVAFPAFPDCLADAIRHGFDASQPFDVIHDRRRTPRLAA